MSDPRSMAVCSRPVPSENPPTMYPGRKNGDSALSQMAKTGGPGPRLNTLEIAATIQTAMGQNTARPTYTAPSLA